MFFKKKSKWVICVTKTDDTHYTFYNRNEQECEAILNEIKDAVENKKGFVLIDNCWFVSSDTIKEVNMTITNDNKF